jgi:hypothetical protein
MTLRSRFLPLLLAAGLAASPAAAFQAQNNFTVRQLDSTRFEVLSRGGLSASDAWCAAGDFVRRGLRMPGATLIWRISEPPRRSGQSIVFFALLRWGRQHLWTGQFRRQHSSYRLAWSEPVLGRQRAAAQTDKAWCQAGGGATASQSSPIARMQAVPLA